jgi:aminoglycoside 3-N-acetyltransferase I
MSARIHTQRLTTGDEALARGLFILMAAVFDEPAQPLNDAYLTSLLARSGFWAFAAFVDGEMVGGLTAHTLPMTRAEGDEVFIFDIAVREDHQRRGVGRQLVSALRHSARAQAISDIFVAADDEDAHALDFYRALGGAAAPVTIFTFTDSES